jgi:aspartate carbamoyltransferase regulatory subunit
MSDLKELKVSAIKDGTVIDHIPVNQLFKVISILELDKIPNQITFGNNLESQRMGQKAIIKINGKFFEDDEINKIALITPNVKLNIIKDYKVIEKKEVRIQDDVVGIVKCFNPKCITNSEKVLTRFLVVDREKMVLKCHYCEKVTLHEHIKII